MIKYQKKSQIVALVLLTFLLISIGSASATANKVLNLGRWAPINYLAMQSFIDTYGNNSSNYNPAKAVCCF